MHLKELTKCLMLALDIAIINPKKLIGYLKEMQKHLNNKDDFINFVKKLDKDLADKIHKEQEQVNE